MRDRAQGIARPLAGLIMVLLGLTACPASESPQKITAPEPESTDAKPPRDSLKAVPPGTRPAGQSAVMNMDMEELRLILVRPGGPADRAGFKAGDRLLAADGKDLSGDDDVAKALVKASREKIFFEVRRGNAVETLPMDQNPPGWLLLSGDTFKGFLISRVRNQNEVEPRQVGQPAVELKMPGYAAEEILIPATPDRPTALLFWGTFSENGDEVLQAFDKSCQAAGDKLRCVVVNTMELFTAVRQTGDYAAELARIHSVVWPEPLAVDLFMRAEHDYGVSKLPSLVLIDTTGELAARFDGAQTDYAKAFAPLTLP